MSGKIVYIVLTDAEADRFSGGLSDVLCWLRGWNAARSGTDLSDNAPIGIEALRDLNLKIKAARE